MSTLYDLMKAGSFPLVVSLPRNDLDLANAAVAGGAQGIKVHLNGYHRASGVVFGSFAEERGFLAAVARLPVPKIVMVGQEILPSKAEMMELHHLGFEGFNLYLQYARPHLFEAGLRPYLALAQDYDRADIEALAQHGEAVVEASVMKPHEYGEALGDEDFARYEEIVGTLSQPVVAPTQKAIKIEDLPGLRRCGLHALLIGAVVTGSTPTSVRTATERYAEALLNSGAQELNTGRVSN
jgi:hypothetical protein